MEGARTISYRCPPVSIQPADIIRNVSLRGRRMVSRLRWVAGAVLLAAIQGEAATSERIRPEVAFQTILDLEQTARLLAILLDSGRSVINENQGLFDDPAKAEKGFTPEVFERQLARMFLDRSGLDLAELDSANIPSSAKKWLKDLLAVSKQVVKDAQPEINQPATQSKLIPAVFGSRVAGRWSARGWAAHGADGGPIEADGTGTKKSCQCSGPCRTLGAGNVCGSRLSTRENDQ